MIDMINLGIIASGIITGYNVLFGKGKDKEKKDKLFLMIFFFFIILGIIY